MIFKQLYLTYGWHRTRGTIVDQSEFESNNKGVSMHTFGSDSVSRIFFTEVSKFILLNYSFKNAHLI